MYVGSTMYVHTMRQVAYKVGKYKNGKTYDYLEPTTSCGRKRHDGDDFKQKLKGEGGGQNKFV